MLRAILLATLTGALGLLAAAPVAAQSDGATVTIIHGIPGADLGLDPELPVDVFVSGLGCALVDFRYGELSPRVPVPAGSYDVEISLANPGGADCGGTVVITADGVPFDDGENATVIAHLTESGGITATKYTNDVSPSVHRDGRLAIHHVAGVGAVDVQVYGIFPFRGWKPVIDLEGVTNPQSAAADLAIGFYLVNVSPAGGHPVAWEFVEVTKGTTTLAYATGSLANGTFKFLADRQDQTAPEPGPEGGASVKVIHGIPGEDLGLAAKLPVDVFVSGLGCALPDFRFGDVTPSIPVPAGTYDIQVTLVDEAAGPCEGPLAIDAPGVAFDEGENATVIAHLAADGAPTATKFTNDLSQAKSRRGRLALHHTAAAPAVDIGVKQRFFWFYWLVAQLEGVVNGDSGSLSLRRGGYVVIVAPAGGHPIFRARAHVASGEATLVYAVGSLANETFQLIVDRQPLD